MCVFHAQDFWLDGWAVSVSYRTLSKCAGERTLVSLAFTVGAQSQPLALARRGRSNTSMEIHVVTQIKSSEAKPKRTVRMANNIDGLESASRTKARRPRKTAANTNAVEDAAYASNHEDAQQPTAKPRLSHLVARGKDLMSGDAASVATAAAIVVGAALIEVELIPGLIIGAGAILLGKLFPEMGAYVRPAIKGAVRAGFFMTQKAREVMAETSEQVHDLVAEVKHEQDKPKASPKAPPVAEPGDDAMPIH